MTCMLCVSGFCIVPYVPFHIHLTTFTRNLVQAWTLHLRSSCTDVNTLKHFMHNSVIIITLFFSNYQVRYFDLGELSIFSVPKSPASANLCCQFIFLICPMWHFFLFHSLKTLASLLYFIWFPSINFTDFNVIFKHPYVCICQPTLELTSSNSFIYLGNKEIYCTFKTSYIICFILHKIPVIS